MERRPVRTGQNKNEKINMLKKSVSLIESEIEKTSDESKKAELEKSLIELKIKLIKEEEIKKDESLSDYSPVLDDHILRHGKYEIENKKQELENKQRMIEEENPELSLYFDKQSRLISMEEHVNSLKSEIEKNIDNPDYDLNEKIAELRKYEKEIDETESFLNQELQKPEIVNAIKKIEEIDSEIETVEFNLKRLHKLSESDQEKRSEVDATRSLN